MKLLKQIRNPHGLRMKFGLSLLGAGLLCLVVFFVLYLFIDQVIIQFFDNAEFEQKHRLQQAESLQTFLDEEELDEESLGRLSSWEKHQPILLLEIYDGQRCIYSSRKDTITKRSRKIYLGDPELIPESDFAFGIHLGEKPVTAIIYADFVYMYYMIGTVVAFVSAVVLFVVLFLFSNRKLIRYICRLEEEVQILEGGNLEYEVSVQGNDELTDLARSMNRMRVSLLEQMKKEQELQQVNRRLITEMSHDLRTPLTGLMLYTEILRFHRYHTEEELQEYLEKIDQKAYHLKQLSDHLFEYAQDGKRRGSQEKRSFQEVCREPLENMICELKARNFQVETELQWNSYPVMAGKDPIERIIENIGSNIVKYAHPDAPIRIETTYSNQYCGLIFMNTVAEERMEGVTESYGVGLESIRNLLKELNGVCNIEQTEAVFEISVLFPLCYGSK